MSHHKIRHQDPNRIYEITNRTLDGLFLFNERTAPAVNALFLRYLTKAVHKYDIQVFHFVLMSNHFHMLVRAPGCNLHLFMQYLTSNFSKQFNALNQRRGPLFPERYKDIAVLDPEALLQRLAYINYNPIKTRVVDLPEQWWGANSIAALTTDRNVEIHTFDADKLRSLRRSNPDLPESACGEHLSFKLAPLPGIPLEGTDLQARLNDLVAQMARKDGLFIDTDGNDHIVTFETRLANEQEVESARPPAQEPPRRPSQASAPSGAPLPVEPSPTPDDQRWQGPPERRPRPRTGAVPLCHATSTQARQDFELRYRHRRKSYTEAIQQWRNGNSTSFPTGTIPPGWLRVEGYDAPPSANVSTEPLAA